MKLLIITQKIDISDDVLGFMHGWVKEFAKQCEQVTVICLYKGEYSLPKNVEVLSLGKESGRSRLKYVYRFYKYIWQERKNYDFVFVHMNHIYLILGGLFWSFLGKKISLWYNHRYGTLWTKFASLFAGEIYYTSPYSFFAEHKKAQIMPAGINTEIFRNSNKERVYNSILYLGRISPVKNIKILIESAKILDKNGIDFTLNIVGEPGENDENYFREIKNASKDLEEKGKIKFMGKVSNFKTPEIYNENEIFINLTNSGSLDKTTLEAMACGCLVLVSNLYFKEVVSKDLQKFVMFREKDSKDLADKILLLFKTDNDFKKEMRKGLAEIVIKKHSLKKLVKRIIN